MMKLFSGLLSIFAVIATQVAVAPVSYAQIQGSVTRITPVPDGAYFYVDGQQYNHAASAVWPTGSKHTLFVLEPVQNTIAVKTKLSFRGWSWSGGALPNPVDVTADSSIGEYQALFDVQYGLSVVFFPCQNSAFCTSPGTILVDGAPVTSNTDIYLPAGAVATLQAVPGPGYVFAGWTPATGQVITGFQDTVTVNGPTTVYPKFQVARQINFATVPPNFMVLADRIQVPTPNVLEWGWNTTHSVGPVSPQQDLRGKWWAFSSWSDGGAANHAYQVADLMAPDTLTAIYVPAANVQLNTLPVGLKLKIDGRDNLLLPYNMNWGVNEVHHVEAPAQQNDAQGRIWVFNTWSNGASAVQDFQVPPDADTTGAMLTATYKQLGKLTITSSLSGVSALVDGAACLTPCDVVRAMGTQVLVSMPASVPQGDGSRSDFSGWTGRGLGDLALTLGPDAQTAGANYHFMNRLLASSDPPNGAIWSVQPASRDNYYDALTMVAVSLTVLPGYRFHRWDGDLSGTIPSGIVAMNAPRSVRALLDSIPYIPPTGVINGAGITPQTGVAAGSVASVFGANLGASVAVAPDGILPQTLGGVTVVAGDRLLPLFFASPTQLNVQLPDDLPPGTQSLTVSSQGQPDVRATFSVVRNAPGLFSQLIDGQAFALAIHEDGSPVSIDAPARRGELLTVYATGLGPVDHLRPEGFAVPQSPPYLVMDGVNVQVGDAVFTAESAFAAPGRLGIDAVQFRLGDGAPSATNATLHLTINGQDSNTLLFPIQ
jgi:uncharacterized protein (TIGR03437 family)